MSEVKDPTEFDEILSNVNFDEIHITYSPMDDDNHNENDETEELLGIAPAPAKNATGTKGMATQEGVCGSTRTGPDPSQGSSPFPPSNEVTETTDKEQVIVFLRWLDAGFDAHEELIGLHHVANIFKAYSFKMS